MHDRQKAIYYVVNNLGHYRGHLYGVGYNKNVNNKNKNQPITNNVKECPASTTIVTTQGGNAHTVIGSI